MYRTPLYDIVSLPPIQTSKGEKVLGKKTEGRSKAQGCS